MLTRSEGSSFKPIFLFEFCKLQIESPVHVFINSCKLDLFSLWKKYRESNPGPNSWAALYLLMLLWWKLTILNYYFNNNKRTSTKLIVYNFNKKQPCTYHIFSSHDVFTKTSVFFLNNENTVTLPGEKKTLLGNYFGSIFSRNIIIAYIYQQSFFFFWKYIISKFQHGIRKIKLRFNESCWAFTVSAIVIREQCLVRLSLLRLRKHNV